MYLAAVYSVPASGAAGTVLALVRNPEHATCQVHEAVETLQGQAWQGSEADASLAGQHPGCCAPEGWAQGP